MNGRSHNSAMIVPNEHAAKRQLRGMAWAERLLLINR
jgi:hypothetical protein